MKKNDNLLDLKGVCDYFDLSESSVRRLVKLSREGLGNFPLPLFPAGHVLRWKRQQVEDWNGENSVTEFSPSVSMPTHATQTRSQAQVQKELKRRHGVDVSPLGNNEANG